MSSQDRSEDSGVMGAGMLMLVLAILLCWLPGLGSLIAGIVGGKAAGGVGKALLASLVPAFLLGVLLFFGATLLTAMPLVGFIFGLGAAMLAMTHVGTLMLGAVIGALLA